MTEIIGVRFKSGGKLYYFNPNGTHVDVGQSVIIETAKGVEFAECVQSNTMVDEMELVTTLRPMLRIATPEDFRQVEQNRAREKKAFAICEKKIQEHRLDMKLVEVQYSFDGSKILFYFTADGRVDFRSLVKDLASVFHTRIELRQIGVRDEARMMGGLGICGRPFCCSQFLENFQPVSIKMAKTQNISLNPTKISGACGRLMCCLKYEQEAYEDLLRRAPRLESLVKTPDGVGVVNQVNLLREQCRVTLDEDPDTVHIYNNGELEIIRNGKGRRPAGYELPEKPVKAERPKLANPVPAPDAKPAPQSAERKEEEASRRPNRRRSASARPAGEKPARPQNTQNPPRRQRTAQEEQGKEKRPAEAEGGQKAHNYSRRRHRPHRRRGGEGGKEGA